MAATIWRNKIAIPLPQGVQHELQSLHDQLADQSNPWSTSIGHIIPRDAQFTSLGDACGAGGGAYCHNLRFWFDILWSDETKRQFDAGKIHINILEFIVVILQLAAAITRAEEDATQFAIQPLSKILIRTDNSPSQNWAHKVSSKSERGQLFVSIYADLLERTQLTVACNHIAGEDNDLADFLSRPIANTNSHVDRCAQIFRKEPRLEMYHFFRPTAEFLSCLHSRLFITQWQASPPLPSKLGHFVTDASTTSCFLTI